jgi:predicted alpha/beta-fold hydrolase
VPFNPNNSLISPLWLPNGHLQSIYPALFRKVNGVQYSREKIVTQDGDFLDLDWSFAENTKSETLVILSHGLEGSSSGQYILGMVKLLNRNGYDCLAWNFRGCGGEMNQTARFYHSGATEDLDVIVKHAVAKGYDHMHLMGFSLGGNLTLKYLGESENNLDKRIESAVVFSVPMDLLACSRAMILPKNIIYMQRFLQTLKPKITKKSKLFPEAFNRNQKRYVRTLYDFDDVYTAPLHGFENADHYYEACSSRNFVNGISIPTLIVNALNDPIVPFESLPVEAIRKHPKVWLEAVSEGGHCGFRPAVLRNGVYWSEYRALAFLKNGMNGKQ